MNTHLELEGHERLNLRLLFGYNGEFTAKHLFDVRKRA